MSARKLAVIDLETDPFRAGHVPRPFCSGFFDGTEFGTIWDEEKCIDRTVDMLAQKSTPLIIYAHNGGKFDWFYFLESLTDQSAMRIINGRIVQAYLGVHEIRDSYSIMPFPLRAYNKKDIDIDKLRAERRNQHRDEIIEYLRIDCQSLYELVVAFWDEFGDILTVGSAGMKQLKGFHKFDCGGAEYDKRFREPYYFGGRVQVFSPGEVSTPMSVYDVNSMYPYVMANYLHPVSCAVQVSRRIERDTAFVTAEGINYGAFAVRTKTGIDFPTNKYGVYNTTIHEWNTAEQTKTFTCRKVLKTYGFKARNSFDTFVNHFYSERCKAQAAGDKIHYLFYKYVLNSTYGKFAQNPDNFCEYCITKWDTMPEPWQPSAVALGKYILWSKPLDNMRYYNICTAASITGAARAMLLQGICNAQDVHYCDTDSIIAGHSGSLETGDTDLGRWKTEVTASSAVFCGKKLYALFDANGSCVKKACKGSSLSGEEIARIAKGETISWSNQVPHFKISGEHGFVTRRIRRTV